MYPISNLVIFHFYLEFRNGATVPIVNSGIKINRYVNRERVFHDLGLQKGKENVHMERNNLSSTKRTIQAFPLYS